MTCYGWLTLLRSTTSIVAAEDLVATSAEAIKAALKYSAIPRVVERFEVLEEP